MDGDHHSESAKTVQARLIRPENPDAP